MNATSQLLALATRLGLLGLATSLIFLLLWWFGSKRAHAPRCRACRHGLSGLVPDDALEPLRENKVCPECGASLLLKGAIVRASRTRRRWALWCGVIMLLASLGALTPKIITSAKNTNYIASAPTRALAILLTTQQRPEFTKSVDEIADRFVSGDLSTGDLHALAQSALKRSADATLPWDDRLDSIIDAAFDRGSISEEEMAAYLRKGLTPYVRAEVQILPGSLTLAYGLTSQPNMSNTIYFSPRLQSLPMILEIESIVNEDTGEVLSRGADNSPFTNVLCGWVRVRGNTTMKQFSVPLNAQTLNLRATIYVRVDESLWDDPAVLSNSRRSRAVGSSFSYATHTKSPLPAFKPGGLNMEWREDIKLSVTLNPSAKLPITNVTDASIAREFAAAVTLDIPPNPNVKGEYPSRILIDQDKLPTSMFAFRGWEWSGSTSQPHDTPSSIMAIIRHADQVRSHEGWDWCANQSTMYFNLKPPADWDGKSITLILIPPPTNPSYDYYFRSLIAENRTVRILTTPVRITKDVSSNPPPNADDSATPR